VRQIKPAQLAFGRTLIYGGLVYLLTYLLTYHYHCYYYYYYYYYYKIR